MFPSRDAQDVSRDRREGRKKERERDRREHIYVAKTCSKGAGEECGQAAAVLTKARPNNEGKSPMFATI
jgi:hypothetical protein